MTSSKPAAKKRGLGRGLDALLGPKGAVSQVQATTAVIEPLPGEVLRKLPVGQLQPGKYQPRREMDEGKLSELADSIKSQGVIQPILVRQLPAGNYEIVAGERRWRASQLAGLDEVPVVVRELEDRTVIAMALIENIQREDLNPLEEAEALQRLISEFTLTHAEAAEAVGRSRAAVSNLLRLLELPVAIRLLLETRRLEMGHARALLTLAPELAGKLAQEAADEGWSVREVERRAQAFAAGKVPSNRPAATPKVQQADIASLETELSEALGAKVAINHGRGGKGKLIIHYTDLDTLDGVLEKLRTRQG
ncbi:ParB/RepB/Spo0J family partition protein [Stenotrophomonas maltophilia]|jgi:ParB family chromosome partitioning protein|uniref:Probable chromosome-partitioning protein ParB n=4 Tax=Gammaproteobacteria TaxID=1236 RepID=A0A246L2V1_9GAMM|nr:MULTISPECIES: ParB/RepB/Spo0J family partition protein [Stenotrophomonas]KDE90903.1 chromosome partitioning protein ParB [Stenotrophomonas maltophilia M30]TGR46378.1 ParB/RepB/Spo0J family partition protein [bacterium M00.F.Ca.ET.199.01.1.1]TGT01557.1 ParB/RepB/Spo0J family partition protein [bacterium M00.F.Ca.ET.177.01.1.1]TGT59254.1 ParB/RepB/Spo0J family partition protein [Mesorhizobium sp. M00.F.Ca.ET.170.01.1.1]TGU10927.1 ParB/RepB/Spo0J family partition protein [bacterium M00.F.Ca.ET